MVTLGMGWNPSSDAGRAGEPVQKYTRSCFSRLLIRSITAHSHRLKATSLKYTVHMLNQSGRTEAITFFRFVSQLLKLLVGKFCYPQIRSQKVPKVYLDHHYHVCLLDNRLTSSPIEDDNLRNCPHLELGCTLPVAGLAALIVERCVGDEGGHVDVPHPVQQEPEILCGQTVQRASRHHVKQTCQEPIYCSSISVPDPPRMARCGSGQFPRAQNNTNPNTSKCFSFLFIFNSFQKFLKQDPRKIILSTKTQVLIKHL